MLTLTKRQKNNRLVSLLFGLVGLVLALIMLVTSTYETYAYNNQINATLCDSNTLPVVMIINPQSDSIVNQPSIILQGTTSHTTQLDIFINNNYSHSIAVSSDGLINTAVALAEGDNTIRLDSYFSCNHNTNSTELVLTYAPVAVPSNGEDIETTTDSYVTSSTNSFQASTASGDPGTIKNRVFNTINDKLRIDGSKLDMTTESYGYIFNRTANWGFVIFGIIGLFAMLNPYPLIRIYKFKNVTLSKSRSKLIILRLLGGSIFISALILILL